MNAGRQFQPGINGSRPVAICREDVVGGERRCCVPNGGESEKGAARAVAYYLRVLSTLDPS